MDPLRGSPWSAPGTVSGFAQSPPNQTLMAYAAAVRARGGRLALDIGCGAARNLLPLARQGWRIAGVDLSKPMLQGAASRLQAEAPGTGAALLLASMDALPLAGSSMDLIVAHGIWNLARSARQFRTAVRDAARIARDGAGLFVFTFSRRTLPASAAPIAGESFVFTDFAGEPQCFLTEDQLIDELAAAGFERDESVPLTEHNLPKPGVLTATRVPVILEAAFRRVPRGQAARSLPAVRQT